MFGSAGGLTLFLAGLTALSYKGSTRERLIDLLAFVIRAVSTKDNFLLEEKRWDPIRYCLLSRVLERDVKVCIMDDSYFNF